jgi:hypothetical protein
LAAAVVLRASLAMIISYDQEYYVDRKGQTDRCVRRGDDDLEKKMRFHGWL